MFVSKLEFAQLDTPPALAVGSVKGFEISAEYCDIAEKRIASVGKDIPLFEAD